MAKALERPSWVRQFEWCAKSVKIPIEELRNAELENKISVLASRYLKLKRFEKLCASVQGMHKSFRRNVSNSFRINASWLKNWADQLPSKGTARGANVGMKWNISHSIAHEKLILMVLVTRGRELAERQEKGWKFEKAALTLCGASTTWIGYLRKNAI